jgi:hypothetical protein
VGAPKGKIPWNAGTSKGWIDNRGYRWLYVEENGRKRARREHRVLMEKHLGRKLEPWEIVHHKDGNRSNNSLENLSVMEFGEHTTHHGTGSRKSWETKRTLEAFALMKESLKEERRVKAELLEALERCLDRMIQLGAEDEPVEGETIGPCSACQAARAAISKAKGLSQ